MKNAEQIADYGKAIGNLMHKAELNGESEDLVEYMMLACALYYARIGDTDKVNDSLNRFLKVFAEKLVGV